MSQVEVISDLIRKLMQCVRIAPFTPDPKFNELLWLKSSNNLKYPDHTVRTTMFFTAHVLKYLIHTSWRIKIKLLLKLLLVIIVTKSADVNSHIITSS